jgi:hypothetical protein
LGPVLADLRATTPHHWVSLCIVQLSPLEIRTWCHTWDILWGWGHGTVEGVNWFSDDGLLRSHVYDVVRESYPPLPAAVFFNVPYPKEETPAAE